MNAHKFPAAVAYTKFLTALSYLALVVGALAALALIVQAARMRDPGPLVGVAGAVVGAGLAWFTLKFLAEMVQVFLHIEANTDRAARLVPPPLALEADEWSYNSGSAAK